MTFTLRGSVDFAKLAPAPLSADRMRAHAQSRHLESPGITLQWREGAADVAERNGVLAIATGRARGGARLAASGEAARWLERYATQGGRAADGVGGGFAVVIVDVNRREATLFVDRFAMESLCYRVTPGALAFADGAAFVPGSSDLDRQALYDYLYFHMIPAPATAYAGVLRVQAGERVVASSGGCASSPWWQPRFDERGEGDLAIRRREFIERVEAAVREEADDDATACFLSGGTDSSTIAGMLTRVRGKPAAAYSIGFDADGYDEMEYARIAARHFGLEHRIYYVTPDDLVASIPSIAASLDQPFGNSSLIPAYYCARNARDDGFTRMLAGDGGDELYGGNSRYALQKLLGYYERVPSALRAAVEPPATQWPLLRRVPGFRQLGGYIRHARVPMPDRLESFNLLQRLDDEGLLQPDFRASVDTRAPREAQRRTWGSLHARDLVNRMLEYDWKYTLADNDLRKVQAATRAAGVSVGYPFLANAVADLSLVLPANWKVRGLRLRWFFKQALRDFLPQPILRKKKHGFGLPFGQWMLTHPGLLRLAIDSLDGVAQRGIVREAYIRELVDTRLPSAPGYYGEMVWILMLLEQWLRRDEARRDVGGPRAPAEETQPAQP